MYLFFNEQGQLKSFSNVEKEGYDNVPEFTDRVTQTANKDIFTGVITVTETGFREQRAPFQEPQFLKIITNALNAVQAEVAVLDGRMTNVEANLTL